MQFFCLKIEQTQPQVIFATRKQLCHCTWPTCLKFLLSQLSLSRLEHTVILCWLHRTHFSSSVHVSDSSFLHQPTCMEHSKCSCLCLQLALHSRDWECWNWPLWGWWATQLCYQGFLVDEWCHFMEGVKGKWSTTLTNAYWSRFRGWWHCGWLHCGYRWFTTI
jgi:hypothetical protein